MDGTSLIADIVASAKEFGIFEFYLPFIIMFAIFWALLTKVKLFGDPFADKAGPRRLARGVNLIVALAASLYIMANTILGISFAVFLSELFGGTFMVILTIIAFVSVLYVVWTMAKGKNPLDLKDGEVISKNWTRLVAFAVVGAVLLALGVYVSTAGTAIFPGLTLPGFSVPDIPTIAFPSIPSLALTTQDLAIILLVVFTGLIVFYVTWGGGKEPKARYSTT